MGETGGYDTHLTVDQVRKIESEFVEDYDGDGGHAHQEINLLKRVINIRPKRSKDLVTNPQSTGKCFSFSLHHLKGVRQTC